VRRYEVQHEYDPRDRSLAERVFKQFVALGLLEPEDRMAAMQLLATLIVRVRGEALMQVRGEPNSPRDARAAAKTNDIG
jgi:hypothetical protein